MDLLCFIETYKKGKVILLIWKTDKILKYKNWDIPLGEEIESDNPIKLDSSIKKFVKDIIIPFLDLKRELFVDGFITALAAKWIFETKNTLYNNGKISLLDVGFGDLRLLKKLRRCREIIYFGIDISLDSYRFEKYFRNDQNVALASVTKIPVEDNSFDIVVSTEVLEHISQIDKAIKEIYRVLKPGGSFFVSIPNNYCYKYKIKGPHADHCNNWTYREFLTYILNFGFELVKSTMRGIWIPLPLWITKTSYQLPFSSKKECYNTNFFYIFKKIC